MATNETEKEFMERVLKDSQANKESYKGLEETKKLNLKPGELYQLAIVRAFGKQDDEYGDWMALQFTDSPVTKGFKSAGENTIYLRSGLMRTFRQRILRDMDANSRYPELEAGVKDGEPIIVTVPSIVKPVKVQFIIEEGEVKGNNSRGFLSAFGEVVEDFPKKAEKADAFLTRVKTERKEYLDSRKKEGFPEDDGKKLGATEIGLNKTIHAHIIRAYAPKDENPNYCIFRFDPKKSKLWDGYNVEKDGVFNRFHLSGLTLKTFRSHVLKGIESKENSPLIQCGIDAEGQPDYVKVPMIPDGGITVRFFRVAKKSANDREYHEVLGEVVKE